MNSILSCGAGYPAGGRLSGRLAHMPHNHIFSANPALFAQSNATRIDALDEMSLSFFSLGLAARKPGRYRGVILTPGYPWGELAC